MEVEERQTAKFCVHDVDMLTQKHCGYIEHLEQCWICGDVVCPAHRCKTPAKVFQEHHLFMDENPETLVVECLPCSCK